MNYITHSIAIWEAVARNSAAQSRSNRENIMMDEKTKQMVMEKLMKWKEKMDKEDMMMKMDDKKMKEMLDKAMKTVDEMNMDAKDTMMVGKMIHWIGKAMMKDSGW